ncbi:dephospho-CoA kinase [Candidatus Pelagibacter sp.]|nr:dephospho-CoA kinase [Candidatus Pelagibacter sp.]
MIIIGILGDIGSGKSHVAQNFGYPVFNADYEVAKLYQKNKNIFNKLKAKLLILKLIFLLRIIFQNINWV